LFWENPDADFHGFKAVDEKEHVGYLSAGRQARPYSQQNWWLSDNSKVSDEILTTTPV